MAQGHLQHNKYDAAFNAGAGGLNVRLKGHYLFSFGCTVIRSSLFLFPAFLMTLPTQATEITPPKAKIVPKVIETHGETRTDNYFWLREKTNPEVIKYLEDENAYTAAMMKDTVTLQEKLYKELVGRIQESDVSVPVRRGDYYYYSRTEKGKQYAIWCRKKGEQGPEEVLLDGNTMAQGHEYFMLGAVSPSPDQTLLAYALDTAGDEEMAIRVKRLATGDLLPDTVENAASTVVWAEDGKTLFYIKHDAAKRPYKLFRHTLGTPNTQDVEVWHEKDERFNVGVAKTISKAYILLTLESQTTTEIRCINAKQPGGNWKIVVPRMPGTEAEATHHGSSFFIRISDTAKTFRLVEAPVANPSQKNWEEVIAARKDVTLEGIEAYADHLVVEERDGGLRRIRVRKFSDGAEHFVSMPEASYSLGVGGSIEYGSNIVRFTYASLVTPSSVYDYDMDTKERKLMKRQPVLGGYDPEQYATERILATAPDGVKVPVSIVYKKGFKKDGTAPLLLYGYGSYGASMDASFSSDRISLLDRGFAYAIAHIRGGADLGKLWHEDGRMLKKRNTFIDFIAAAQVLIDQKYTSPRKLAIMGRSAGGLLMGAVTNMRPDLFGAVIAGVPFVDVVNTMEDATLPLTVGEYEEWGNPADKTYYSYMRSYSPYDNIERQEFPNILATGGLNDPRVSYWEPTKWTAKLRAMKKDTNLLLLKTNMGAGHFGASGRYERFKEIAFEYAFLLKALGQPLQ